ncbi:DedA family protein [Prauserella cavernicola]|uniref:DedA family protein n=1 Tax=Prauserella cavernicola TaxID=2800127 RepID=A0A934V5W0_9PSEU|nr:DedA family protein [Prauserella cavernicola]MBK1785038.1 DedA family protein [Prauserella cavernicola]
MDVSTLSLLALFLIAAVPLAPTEVTLVGMGVVAATTDGPVAPIILVASAGCLLCDYLLYVVGRRGGPLALDRVRRRRAGDATVRWLSRHLDRRPVAVLVIARWLPAGGTAGSLLAGSLRWPRSVFVVASVIGVTLWSTYAVLLGYLGGAVVEESALGLLLSLGVAVVLAVTVASVWRRRSGHDLEHARGTSGGTAVHPAEQA